MSQRDNAMARIAVAMVSLDDAKELCSGTIQQFIDPSTEPADLTGSERQESLNDAFMCCHNAAQSIQAAMEALASMGKPELSKGEDLGGDEDDDGEDDDGGESAESEARRRWKGDD